MRQKSLQLEHFGFHSERTSLSRKSRKLVCQLLFALYIYISLYTVFIQCKKMYPVVLVVLVLFHGCRACVLTGHPEDTVTEVGETATLTCTTDFTICQGRSEVDGCLPKEIGRWISKKMWLSHLQVQYPLCRKDPNHGEGLCSNILLTREVDCRKRYPVANTPMEEFSCDRA